MSQAGNGAGEGMALSTDNGDAAHDDAAATALPAMQLVEPLGASPPAAAHRKSSSNSLPRSSMIPIRPSASASGQRLMSAMGSPGKAHPADLVSSSNPDPHSHHHHNRTQRGKEYSMDSTADSQYTRGTANAVEGDTDSYYNGSDEPDSVPQLASDGIQSDSHGAAESSGRPVLHTRIPSATRAWADSPVSTPGSEEIKALSGTPNGVYVTNLPGVAADDSPVQQGGRSLASSIRTAVGPDGSRPSTAGSGAMYTQTSAEPSHAGQVLAETTETRLQPIPIVELADGTVGAQDLQRLSTRTPSIENSQAQPSISMQRAGSLRKSPSVQTSGSGHTSYHATRTGESPQSSPRQLQRRPSTQGQIRAGQQAYPDDAFTETLADGTSQYAQPSPRADRNRGQDGRYSIDSTVSRTQGGTASSISGHRSHGHEAASHDGQQSPTKGKHPQYSDQQNGAATPTSEGHSGAALSRSKNTNAAHEERQEASSSNKDRDKDRSRKQLGEWTLGKTLGAGSMGKVKLGISTISGEKVSFVRDEGFGCC